MAAAIAAARFLQRPLPSIAAAPSCNSRRHRRRPFPVTAAFFAAPRFM
jgi:hypothetical protein